MRTTARRKALVDPYDIVDDEVVFVIWHLTRLEVEELCTGMVPVRLHVFAQEWRRSLAGEDRPPRRAH